MKLQIEYFNKQLEKISPTRFFIIAAVLLSIWYNFFTPPFQASDETNHAYRISQISEGHFLPNKQNKRLGGEVDAAFLDYKRPYQLLSTNLVARCEKKTIAQTIKNHKKVFVDFPNTSYYSPVSYLPQAIAWCLGSKLFARYDILYYLSRIFSVIVWICLVAWSIHLIPFQKWTLVCLGLLPMQLYISNSLSADTLSNGLCFLLLGYTLYVTYEKQKLTRKHIIILGVLGVLIALGKLVYIGLLLIVFIIPKEKFGSAKKKSLSLLFIGGLAGIAFVFWSCIVNRYYISYADYDKGHRNILGLSEVGNLEEQKAYILSHGFYIIKVIFRSIFEHPQTYLQSYIGNLGQYDVPFVTQVWSSAYLLIFLIIGMQRSEKHLTLKIRIVSFLAATLAFALLILSQHLTWDRVGEGISDLIQGRYLIPIFPFLFILVFSFRLSTSFHPLWVLIPFMLCIHTYSLKKIDQRYSAQSHNREQQFFTNMEQSNADKILTNQSQFSILYATLLNTKTAYSGHQSVQLNPEGSGSEFGCNFTCQSNSKHAYFYAEAMVKGEGVKLVVSSESQNKQALYITNDYEFLPNEKGWKKINMGFTLDETFRGKIINVYAWNTSKDITFIDDLRWNLKEYDYNPF
jgi:uncharacterized membrane protein